jgi:twinkle protein
MDISLIKQKLADDVEGVCKHLLKAGERKGHEWRVGSVLGEEGKSLGVHLTGDKKGVWCDFSTGETGDLIDLWAAARGMGLAEALSDIETWLGLERVKPLREPKKTYVRPPKPKCQAPQARVRDYLTEERNIPLEILERYKVGEQGDMIIFPFLLPNGELAMAKTRKAEAGAKPKPTAKDCEPVLFGWQGIDPNSRDVILTEGEIDALSWAAYGFPAMSLPFGGGKGAKQQWIECEFERMERFERIYLATDMDAEGEAAAIEIAGRLGRHRCLRVQMPYKDGNECLVNGVPKEAMRKVIAEAISLDPEGLRKPREFADAVIALFHPKETDHPGYHTPYSKLGKKLMFRPGEVTLWSGASGMGKSQILSDCTVDWVRQGGRVCLSSLEMKGPQSLKRMVKQTAGIETPSEKGIKASLEWLDRGLLVYELVGKTGIGPILDVFDYAQAKYGCDLFIIDSLMRLGVAADDYTGQEKAMFQIVEWTIAKNVHLHLVAHARKGTPNSGAPETEDVKGAMEIGANAFNIVTVWRNRQQEDDIKKLEMSGNDIEADRLRQKPGVILNVAKQRNGDFEGKIGLWFDQETYRYYSAFDKSLWKRSYLNIQEGNK